MADPSASLSGTGARGPRVTARSGLKRARRGLKYPIESLLAGASVLPLDRRQRTVEEAALLEPRRILAVRTDRVGDLLVSTPLLAGLHRRWPGARITVITGPKNRLVLEGLPFVEAGPVVGSGPASWLGAVRWLASEHFDLAIGLRAEVLSAAILCAWSGAPVRVVTHATHVVGAYNVVLGNEIRHHATRFARAAELLGAQGIGARPIYVVSDAARATAEAAVRAVRPSAPAPIVGLQVPNTVTARRARYAWPLHRLIDLARLLIADGAHVVLCGFGPELVNAQVVRAAVPTSVVAPALPLGGLAALLGTVDVFVSHFTGSLHLAEAVGCSTVAIGSTEVSEYWRPLGARHHLLTAANPAGVPVEAVLEAVRAAVARASRPPSGDTVAPDDR